jgi:hypothetical protein
LGKDKRLNICSGPKYAFLVLLTTDNSPIKNGSEILALLKVIWEPSYIAVMHYKGHQRSGCPASCGNAIADRVVNRLHKLVVWKWL